MAPLFDVNGTLLAVGQIGREPLSTHVGTFESLLFIKASPP